MMNDKFYIFTPGPVKMPDYVLEEGSMQLPYFRNDEFSEILLDCQKRILSMLNGSDDYKVIFLASSGTGAMEAAVMNLLLENDRPLIINGGSFGKRFVDICKIYDLELYEHKINYGKDLVVDDLLQYNDCSALLVNGHETSTGVLYDLDELGNYSKKKDLLFIVDGISMFLTDEIDLKRMNIDALILSSQKGLALPPGLSLVILSKRAQDKVKSIKNKIKSLYFRFSDYLTDMERGQTPYTPSLSIIYQLYRRLIEIDKIGISNEIMKAKRVAEYFRKKISGLPLEIFPQTSPNAMTTLTPVDDKSAYEITEVLKNDYRIYVCPNGGELRDKIFRVAHMGDIDEKYTDILIDALFDFYKIKRTI